MASPQRIIKALSSVVKNARRKKGLSQERLALAADLNKNHIAKIEQCRTSASLVVTFQIAEALGLSVSALTGQVESILQGKKL